MNELHSDYALSLAVAQTVAQTVGAVYIGGIGTDWAAPAVYPYAVVGPQTAERERGGVTRAVRVRLAVRGADFAQKPKAVEGADGVFIVGAIADLSALVADVSDALSDAALGAPVESISTAYDTEPQAPVETAEITVNFADPQAFGDAF